MKYLVLAVAAGLLFAGCGSDKAEAPSAPAASAPAAEPASIVKIAPELNVGDIEAKVEFELTPDPEAAAPGVTSEELRNQLSKLNMVTVTIDGNRPAELWLNIDLSTELEFPERPVAARGRLIRDLENGQKETIYTFETVFDENASARKRRVEGEYPLQHFRADALKGLAELPETMLIYAEMDVVMMPKGTDARTLFPATAKGAPEDETTLLSNPMRVNYIPGAAPAPEAEVAPAIGAPEPGAPADAPAAEAPAAEAPVEAPPADAPVAETPAETPAAEASSAGN